MDYLSTGVWIVLWTSVCYNNLMIIARKKSFTLIELMVVIFIIALLATIIGISVGRVKSKARDAKRKGDLKTLATAMELYLDDNNTLPEPDCGGGNDAWSSWACWDLLLPTSGYITGNMPHDPKDLDLGYCGEPGSDCYLYHYCRVDDDKFVISADLENDSDPEYEFNDDCSSGGPNYYWVSNY